MRVLLVDDERLLLKVMEHAIRGLRPEWEVLAAASGEEGIGLLRTQGADVVVADIMMPGMDGMGLLSQVRADPALAPIPFIFLTTKDDRNSLRAGMIAGADDYLTKPARAEELVDSIETRLRRRARALPQDPEAALLRESLQARLTVRELEILIRIGRGLVSKEIAAELGISPRTVDVHRTNMMQKLDLHNAASLAGLAVRANLT